LAGFFCLKKDSGCIDTMIILVPLCILLLALVIIYHDRMEERRLLKAARSFVGEKLIQESEDSKRMNLNDHNRIIVSEFNCITRQMLLINHDSTHLQTEDLKFVNLPGFIQYIECSKRK